MIDYRLLFILKTRHDYSNDLINADKLTVATGMWNSSKFIVDMLNDAGVCAEQILVTDNNDIDREVKKFNPTHVIIEGYWVIPEKFDQLKQLHPTVKWVIRCHSNIPFLANEGSAFEWTADYLKRNLFVAVNSPKIFDEFKFYAQGLVLSEDQITTITKYLLLLPNYYPTQKMITEYKKGQLNDIINIGCFGAIRPLKNQMLQAMAACMYAKKHKKYLKFHMNVNRVEGNGASILKNLRAFFNNMEQAELVEHPWLGHKEFLTLVSEMDICMQVSFSETFNIVAADAVAKNIPILVSSEIPFINTANTSKPTSVHDMIEQMEYILKHSHNVCEANLRELKSYCDHAKNIWLHWLN